MSGRGDEGQGMSGLSRFENKSIFYGFNKK